MFSRRRRALICPSPVRYFTRLSEKRCPCSTSLDETKRQPRRSARSVLTALFEIASFWRNHQAVNLNLPCVFLVAKHISDDFEERRLAVVALAVEKKQKFLW